MVDAKKIINAGFLVVLAAAIVTYAYPTMRQATAPWYGPTVTQDEVSAMGWVDQNVPKLSHFASDLFACEAITAVAGQVCAIGGAWELADHPNERYQDNEKAFLTNSSAEAHRLLQQYNVSYVLVARRNSFYAYGWKDPQIDKFNDKAYFEMLHEEGSAFVYRVNLNAGERKIP